MTPEERQQLISQYEAGYDEVTRSLEGFPAEQLTAHPLPGKWSAREIVQHLADSEMNAAIRLRRLLSEDRPVIHAYDQDDYARRLKYNEREIEPALESLRSSRATTAQLLVHLSDEDWKREGWHPESGLYTTENWLRIYAAHAHNHAAQIRRLKEEISGQWAVKSKSSTPLFDCSYCSLPTACCLLILLTKAAGREHYLDSLFRTDALSTFLIDSRQLL